MTTAIPAPAAAAAQAQAAATALTVLAAAAPDKIAALPAGTLLEAVTKALAARGVVEVMTEAGPLTLKLPAGLQRLPAGAALTLQAFDKGGQTGLRLVAINGRPLLPGLGAGLVPGTPATSLMLAGQSLVGQTLVGQSLSGQSPAAQNLAALTPGQPATAAPAGLVATLLRPTAASGAAPAATAGAAPAPMGAPPPALAGLPPGTQLTVRIAGLSEPGSSPPTPASPQQPAPAGSSPAASATIPSPPPAAAPRGGEAPPTAALPPAFPPAPPPATGTPSAGAPLTLAGTVTAHPPNGNALVQTSAGLLSLPSGLPLPPGAGILLDVVAPPLLPLPTATAPIGQGLAGQGLAGQGWQALADAADTLAAAGPQAADPLMRAMPTVGPRLAAGLALFSGALRAGEFRQLAAEGTVKGLEKAGRRELAERLRGDFEALADDARQAVGDGQWRAYTMPLVHGAVVEPIRLFVRRAGGEDESGGGKPGVEQRFVLEVRMSRLGRVQLDGLVNRETKGFDLIVRTGEPLSNQMRQDIAGLFAGAGQLTGTKGSVAFQSGRFIELPPVAPVDPTATRISV